jgi:hypothetical protein
MSTLYTRAALDECSLPAEAGLKLTAKSIVTLGPVGPDPRKLLCQIQCEAGRLDLTRATRKALAGNIPVSIKHGERARVANVEARPEPNAIIVGQFQVQVLKTAPRLPVWNGPGELKRGFFPHLAAAMARRELSGAEDPEQKLLGHDRANGAHGHAAVTEQRTLAAHSFESIDRINGRLPSPCSGANENFPLESSCLARAG